MRRATLLLVFLTAATPATASAADSVVTAFAGVPFGGDSPGHDPAFGVAAAWLGSPLGFEVEAAHAPGFFGNDALSGDNGLTSMMANVVVSGPLGRVRPYASGGVGILQSRVDGPGGLFGIDRSDAGMNLGAGLLTFFGRVGVRGDLRYFRNVAPEDADDTFNHLEFGSTDYWRVTLGLAVKF